MPKTVKKEKVVLEFGFGDRVRKARLHANLGQKELSEKIGQYPSAIAYIERGGQPRNLWETCQAIGDVTGVDPFWLLTGESRTKAHLYDLPIVAALG